jgi:hypothetical protein
MRRAARLSRDSGFPAFSPRKRIIAATKKRWRRQKAEAAEASAPAKKVAVKKAVVKAPSAKATKKVASAKRAAKKSAPTPAVA